MLTEEGVAFTKAQSEVMKAQIQKIKFVICSPNTRALQTAQIFFNTKENKEIKVIVVPESRSIFESQYDLPLRFHENMEDFKEFDFSLFQKLRRCDQNWFIDEIANPKIRRMV